MIKQFIYFIFLGLISVKSYADFCGAKLSIEQQVQLYNLTLDALKESFQDMKDDVAAQKVEDLRQQRPHIIHVVGHAVKKSKKRLHLSLCYRDESRFFKCSEAMKHLKEEKKLADFYTSLLMQPLKPMAVESFGEFVAVTFDLKYLSFKDIPVTPQLHISLIKIRDNEALSQTLTKKLSKKVQALEAFVVAKAACRKDKKDRYTNFQARADQSPVS